MFAFHTANYYLSVSTTFSRAAGMIVGTVAPAHVATNAYCTMVKPIVDWQFMLVLGLPIGAWLAARVARQQVQFTTALPEAWVNRFGTSPARCWDWGCSAASSWASGRAWRTAERRAMAAVVAFSSPSADRSFSGP
jgi:hypothetical protein